MQLFQNISKVAHVWKCFSSLRVALFHLLLYTYDLSFLFHEIKIHFILVSKVSISLLFAWDVFKTVISEHNIRMKRFTYTIELSPKAQLSPKALPQQQKFPQTVENSFHKLRIKCLGSSLQTYTFYS